jgi:hypothetical protein
LEAFHCCCTIPIFYAIFGDVKQTKGLRVPENYGSVVASPVEELDKAANQRMSWVLLSMMIAPLFSVASHSGYILMAWLTEPSNTTVTALIVLALIVPMSLIFRQCYKANADIDLDFKCNQKCTTKCISKHSIVLLFPLAQCVMHIIKVVMQQKQYYKFCKDGDQPPGENIGEVTRPLLSHGHGAKFSNKPFNTQAFCIVMGWSAFVVGPLALTVIAYSEMPLKLLTLLAIFSTSSRFSSSSSLCLLHTRSLC